MDIHFPVFWKLLLLNYSLWQVTPHVGCTSKPWHLWHLSCLDFHLRLWETVCNCIARKWDRKLHCNLNRANIKRGITILEMGAAWKWIRTNLRIFKKPWLVATGNFFTPLRDIPCTHGKCRANQWQRLQCRSNLGWVRIWAEVGHRPVGFTLEENWISFQKDLKSFVTRELLFWKSATGTEITTGSIVDYKAIQKVLTEVFRILHFTQKWINLLKLLSGNTST
jgi:hypothetical protein